MKHLICNAGTTLLNSADGRNVIELNAFFPRHYIQHIKEESISKLTIQLKNSLFFSTTPLH